MMQQEALPVKGIFGAAWVKFKKEMAMLENENKSIFLRARYNGQVDLPELRKAAQHIYEQILPIPGLVGWLHEPGRSQYYLYRHGIDVAVLAGLAGMWLEYETDAIQELVFAGLIHDIGKARVPFSIISKPSRLNGAEQTDAHDHVSRSWEMLRETGAVNERVLEAVSQHHERLDGSGYPLGNKGDTVSLWARIIGIADVYDALVSNRYYRRGISPFEAFQLMKEEMETTLDEALMDLMFKRLAEGLVGQQVKLHDGKKGIIRLYEYGKENQPILEMEDGDLLQLGLKAQFSVAELVY
ncbi:HD-GYP domain-containing protein [Azotosporobacter soli]|uniref:HD-GYP domain-containing protein n=1 Tax=Azotosporobacter soli TaxID=3055040 RepID=UPI0031FED0E9